MNQILRIISTMPRLSQRPTLAEFLMNGGISLSHSNKQKKDSFWVWLTLQLIIIAIGYFNPVGGIVANAGVNAKGKTTISDVSPNSLLEEVADFIYQNSSDKGKDYIRNTAKAMLKNQTIFKSSWIRQALFIPSPHNKNFGSFLVSYQTSKGVRNIITINKFSRDFYDKWMNASSIGRFYLNNIAINKREFHSAIANALWSGVFSRYQSLQELEAFKNFVELSDQQAYDKHVAQSHVFYGDMRLEKTGLFAGSSYNLGNQNLDFVNTQEAKESYQIKNEALDWVIKNQAHMKSALRFAHNPTQTLKGLAQDKITQTRKLREVFKLINLAKGNVGKVKGDVKLAVKKTLVKQEIQYRKYLAQGRFDQALFIKNTKNQFKRQLKEAVLPVSIVKTIRIKYNKTKRKNLRLRR